MAGAFRLLGKKRKLILMGHACGVRVQRVQKVQRVQRGRLTGLRPEGFLRFVSLTALWAEGCGIALTGDEYEVSVMREGS